MAVKIGDYYFDGPFSYIRELDKSPGVLAVIDKSHGRQAVTDVRPTPNVRKTADEISARRIGSATDESKELLFAAIYTPNQTESARQQISTALEDRQTLPLPLGGGEGMSQK